ncbi:hypothetical protein [Glaciihabitans sp. UYNi722]|uniref:hypothetical protein n=1 Tax=Glaciihabitans sp. UYNi722 TaxID=3156344 RepID=UPI0033952D8E
MPVQDHEFGRLAKASAFVGWTSVTAGIYLDFNVELGGALHPQPVRGRSGDAAQPATDPECGDLVRVGIGAAVPSLPNPNGGARSDGIAKGAACTPERVELVGCGESAQCGDVLL